LRVLYRLKQFWLALTAATGAGDLEEAQRALGPQLMAVFEKMQPSEQAHSLWVYRQLRETTDISDRQAYHDLLAAALLHDAGKSRYPLRVWERVLIVLGKAFFSQHARAWGGGTPQGWRRAFVVAEQHPVWGAEMALQAGAAPRVAMLIRRHQEKLPHEDQCESLENHLLRLLQHFDEER
jgi:hypothetical protein